MAGAERGPALVPAVQLCTGCQRSGSLHWIPFNVLEWQLRVFHYVSGPLVENTKVH